MILKRYSSVSIDSPSGRARKILATISIQVASSCVLTITSLGDANHKLIYNVFEVSCLLFSVLLCPWQVAVRKDWEIHFSCSGDTVSVGDIISKHRICSLLMLDVSNNSSVT